MLGRLRLQESRLGLLCLGLAALAWCEASLAEPVPPPSEAEIARLEAETQRSPQDEATREALGDALFRAGRAFDSMRALNPGSEPGASWVPELRKAAELYLESGRREPAKEALRQAIELSPGDTDLYAELAAVYEREKAGIANPAARPSDGPAAEPSTPEVPEPASAAPLPHEIASRLGVERSGDLAVLLGLALILAFAVGLLARSLRGKGDLAVAIDYPADRRGNFSVRLEKRRRKRTGQSEPAPETTRASSRLEHNMVSRETHFRGVPARTWYVVLEGWLEEIEGERRRSSVLEEREVWLQRARTQRVEFDLRPRVAPVEVRIVSRGEVAPSARIALAGDPTSLRYARDGFARLSLPPGRYRLVAAGVDAVAERTLLIEDLAPQTLVIDLGDGATLGDDLVFQDCEGAVEPYLQGHLSVAANALEREGQAPLAHLLRARFHKEHGELERAAQAFENAGRLLEAAETHAENAAFERAAALFERAGDASRAAEMHNAAGDLLRAGRAYEESGDLENAAICYREGQATTKLIDVLEKQGEAYEAGQLALESGDVSRALRSLQQVDARHERYPEVCRLLAEQWSAQGKLELAVQKADEAITFPGASEASADTFVWYGELLARAGKTERALRTFEELLEREPEHPGIAERIRTLQAELAGATTPTPSNDRYESVRMIGRGGMGVVYEARDTRLGRTVALKRLPDNLKDHPRAVELFLREARSAAALNHRNIVTVHDVDQDDTGFFLTMELLEGEPLNEIVKRKRIAPRDTALLGVQIATGLEYAHERRIIHRDIKTPNLFFTNDRTVKIMDFGLAKMVAEVRKAASVIGGTPYYMAPEQSLGEAVDPRADLYSLGVTLFELVTKTLPFPDGDVTYRHRHEAPPDPRTRIETLPASLCELILHLLEKDPEARPASAAEVGARLKRIAEELLAT
ncbi:MAG: protein kinase domain-containing protein [Myxococcota bacterium]